MNFSFSYIKNAAEFLALGPKFSGLLPSSSSNPSPPTALEIWREEAPRNAKKRESGAGGGVCVCSANRRQKRVMHRPIFSTGIPTQHREKVRG